MPTKKFAEGTTVPVERSRGEIERALKTHKATGFMYGEQGDRAMIAFELAGRRYRMDLHYPPLSDFYNLAPNQYTKRMDSDQRAMNALEKEKQRLWRGLALLVKAKLTAVADGISTLEIEMQPYTVMPNGETVGEWLAPQIEEAYRTRAMPPLLPDARVRRGIVESE